MRTAWIKLDGRGMNEVEVGDYVLINAGMELVPMWYEMKQDGDGRKRLYCIPYGGCCMVCHLPVKVCECNGMDFVSNAATTLKKACDLTKTRELLASRRDSLECSRRGYDGAFLSPEGLCPMCEDEQLDAMHDHDQEVLDLDATYADFEYAARGW